MQFKTVALIGKYNDSATTEPLLALADMLKLAGRSVIFETNTAKNMGVTHFPTASITDIGEQAQLAIVMGGDGTMLGVARELAPYDISLVGINHGRVGFITDIPLAHAQDLIGDMLQGNYTTEERFLLQGRVIRQNEVLLEATALNDVVVNRAGTAGMIELQVEVDGLLMSSQRADGLIIATPTGSTAYALSANGPILHPSLSGIVMVPIAPQALSNRPIAIPDTSKIRIMVTHFSGEKTEGASVHFDMQSWSHLQEDDYIEVERSKYTSQFLHPRSYSYYATLRHKLHWNLM